MKKRMLFHVILLLILTWGGFSGCGGDEIVSPPGTVEAVEVTDRYVGDNIYFKIDGTFNEGYVVEGVSANEVKVRLDDRSTLTISLDRVRGTRIADHSDVGVEVVLLGDRNKNEDSLGGEIVAVFDDGMRKIRIYVIEFTDDRPSKRGLSLIRFVDKDIEFKEGGYLTLEEFFRFINGLD